MRAKHDVHGLRACLCGAFRNDAQFFTLSKAGSKNPSPGPPPWTPALAGVTVGYRSRSPLRTRVRTRHSDPAAREIAGARAPLGAARGIAPDQASRKSDDAAGFGLGAGGRGHPT